MRRKILSFLLGSTLAIAAVAPAAAQTECNNVGGGGAAALVALVNANISGVGVNACEIDVDALNNSLNNLLRNADISVLENILNNSPILNDSLNDLTVRILENGDIAIGILSGGVVFDPIVVVNM